MNEFKYLKEGVTSDMIGFLMEEYNLSLPDAVNVVYDSDTFEKLSNPATGLYFQSSKYVYSYLQTELTYGSMAG